MEELFKKLNLKPKNEKIYNQAFIHTSYAYEHKLNNSYETLEFLGDAIVDLAVSDYLYRKGNIPEGKMTKIRASYVCENALSEFANELNFSKYIKLGKGEQSNGGAHKKAILADVFESFIAAIYLDLGFQKAKETVLKIIVPYIEDETKSFFLDYKSKLQETVQDMQKQVNYVLIKETGPSHNKKFQMSVKIDEITYGTGTGHTKKEAEQEAAKSALTKLAKK